jgi:hypothetical protein
VVRGAAKRRLVRLGALKVEVKRVLPGHAHAAVELDGLLRGAYGGVTAAGLSDRRGDWKIRVALGEDGRRVPGRAGGRLHEHEKVG